VRRGRTTTCIRSHTPALSSSRLVTYVHIIFFHYLINVGCVQEPERVHAISWGSSLQDTPPSYPNRRRVLATKRITFPSDIPPALPTCSRSPCNTATLTPMVDRINGHNDNRLQHSRQSAHVRPLHDRVRGSRYRHTAAGRSLRLDGHCLVGRCPLGASLAPTTVAAA